jgi:site-specific recombinase XerD
MRAARAENSDPALPKGIYRRGDAYYVDVLDASGKRVRRSFGSDLLAALEERARIEKRRARKLALAPTSFEQLVENWLDRHALRSRPKTLDEVRAAAKRILAEFGDMDARKLTEQRIQAYVVRRRKQCGVEQTNKDIRAVRAVLRLAVRQKVLDALPMHVELLPSVLKKRIPQAVSLEDFTRLLAYAHQQDANSAHPILEPLLRLAYFTGLRHQELLHLDWADIDFRELLVCVRAKPDEDFLPKSHCERDVPIPAALATYLAEYRTTLEQSDPHDPVLQPTRRNARRRGSKPLRWHEMCHPVRKAFVEAGIGGRGKPVGLHALRHSYCTNLVRSGADIEQLRALAGHSSIVVSQRYLWSDTRSRRSAAEGMFQMVEAGIRASSR